MAKKRKNIVLPPFALPRKTRAVSMVLENPNGLKELKMLAESTAKALSELNSVECINLDDWVLRCLELLPKDQHDDKPFFEKYLKNAVDDYNKGC